MDEFREQTPADEAIIRDAFEWVRKVDRGLDADEQASFMNWMKADKRHGVAYRTQAKGSRGFEEQVDWQLDGNVEPEPNALAPLEHRFRRHLPAVLVIAALLILLVGAVLF